MGSHISVFFPHAVERSPDAVGARLDLALSGLQADLALIRDRGRFSTGIGGWNLRFEDATVTGAGPSGLSILVFPTVVELTSLERFGAVERPDQGIHTALRRIFEKLAAAFGAGGQLAVAAGGYGDTDRASDLARAGAGFAEVCGCLQKVVGPPAPHWSVLELGLCRWYLSVQDAEPCAAADRGDR